MAKVRQPYDEPVVVPALDHRTVNPGQVVTVDDREVASFLAAGWTPADADTKKTAAKRADVESTGASTGASTDTSETAPAAQEVES